MGFFLVSPAATAPRAAGVIHSDLERGVITAEIISYDDVLAAGSTHATSGVRKVRKDGKDYVLADGDIVDFRFNV